MGNCQAAEAATVVIEHPGGRVELIYWSLSASQVMASNPGYYVAVIISSQPAPNASTGAPVKHLKLLRPDDTLHIGHVYRLVSFEEVLREFSSKKSVRLSRLMNITKEKRRNGGKGGGGDRTANAAGCESSLSATVTADCGSQEAAVGGGTRSGQSRSGQWRPALQSIAEFTGI